MHDRTDLCFVVFQTTKYDWSYTMEFLVGRHKYMYLFFEGIYFEEMAFAHSRKLITQTMRACCKGQRVVINMHTHYTHTHTYIHFDFIVCQWVMMRWHLYSKTIRFAFSIIFLTYNLDHVFCLPLCACVCLWVVNEINMNIYC